MPADPRPHLNSIVKFRVRKGWSIREAALAAKMDGFTFAGLERGEINLHDARAMTLAKLFECTIDELRAPCIAPARVVKPASRRNLVAGRGRSRWAGRLKIPPKAHPLVRQLFELLNDQRVVISDIAEKSGVQAGTISDWRYRRSPTVVTFEAALNALGFELVIRRRKD
jgi:hypothetical protein